MFFLTSSESNLQNNGLIYLYSQITGLYFVRSVAEDHRGLEDRVKRAIVNRQLESDTEIDR